MEAFVTGALMGIIAVIGLFLASRAHDPMFYAFGLLLFAFGLIFVFGLIHRHTGKPNPH
jgi:hypothetical protein